MRNSADECQIFGCGRECASQREQRRSWCGPLQAGAGPDSRSTIVDGATHELNGHAEQFTQLVEAFLSNITGTSSN